MLWSEGGIQVLLGQSSLVDLFRIVIRWEKDIAMGNQAKPSGRIEKMMVAPSEEGVDRHELAEGPERGNPSTSAEDGLIEPARNLDLRHRRYGESHEERRVDFRGQRAPTIRFARVLK